jgi:hypothetical protein
MVRALRIRADRWEYENFACFLMMTAASVLETLHLVDVDNDDLEWFLNSRTADGPQKFPRLSSLIIEHANLSQDMYDALAVAFPSVKHFTCINGLKHALAMLRDSLWWPDILTVNLWGNTNRNVNSFKVRDMLRARIEKEKPIPRLCIVNKPPLFPNFLLHDYVHLEYMHPFPAWPAWGGIFEGLSVSIPSGSSKIRLTTCTRVVT